MRDLAAARTPAGPADPVVKVLADAVTEGPRYGVAEGTKSPVGEDSRGGISANVFLVVLSICLSTQVLCFCVRAGACAC